MKTLYPTMQSGLNDLPADGFVCYGRSTRQRAQKSVRVMPRHACLSRERALLQLLTASATKALTHLTPIDFGYLDMLNASLHVYAFDVKCHH